MNDLLTWASKQSRDIQAKFTNYYSIRKNTALKNEVLGGAIENDVITFQMMRWIISEFEFKNKLAPTFSEKDIYQ